MATALARHLGNTARHARVVGEAAVGDAPNAGRCALLALTLAGWSAAGASIAAADGIEPFRPQFHYSPARHWMNDPNGLVYLDGEYHLFYQYNPDAEVWGPMHWGHAVSSDLMHWDELPLALRPDSLGMVFSGSVVVDRENTSGLGSGGRVPLIAVFTSHDEAAKRAGRGDFQTQSMAYSVDKGRTWTRYPGNPVLPNPGLRDFRDPKISWFEAKRRWIMTLVAGDRVSFYSSQDLKTWRHESDFGQSLGAHGGVWECPDLFEMTVAGEAVRKFVLLVSVNPGAPNGGSGTQYFIGDFDGHRFIADAPGGREAGAADWIDFGTDDYAGVTWSNLPHGRRLFIGWMSNWTYAQQVPTAGWRGSMTLPRDLSLVRSPRGLALRMLPAPEVQRLRRSRVLLQPQTVTAALDLTGGLGAVSGGLELDLAVDTGAAESADLQFGNAAGELTVLRLDRAQHRYELDRSRSGIVAFHPGFSAVQSAPAPPGATSTRLHVWLDHSSVEIFVNDGETVLTAAVFPRSPYNRIRLVGTKPIKLESAAVYALAGTREP